MRELATVLSGIGLLIFAYLVLSKPQAVAQVAEGIAKSSTNIIGTLQGNKSNLGFAA